MLLALLACSATPFVYPPTALHTVDLSPPEEGEGSLAFGGTTFVGSTFFPDILGGMVDGGVAVGLPRHLDVSARAFALMDSGGATVTVGWTPLRTDRWEGGLALGLGGSNHHKAGSTDEKQEDGTTLVTDTWDYTYWSLAPALTLRQAWKPTKWLRLPAAVRYSHAFAAGYVGDAPAGDYYVEYVDACVGPEFITGPMRFGLDLGVLTGFNPATPEAGVVPFPRVGLSLALVLPLWGEPVTRSLAGP